MSIQHHSSFIIHNSSLEYESDAQAFCQAWQSGQSEFTLHTSGSTGIPKPIQLTRAQMQASAQLTGRALGLKPGDSALVCLNIHYIAGTMMLVRGLELGLSMTIIEPTSNPLSGFSSAVDHFDFTALVPLQLQTILASTGAELEILNGMKAILVGGAATSPALEQALQVVRAPIYATYGMTETVSHIALRRLNGPEATDFFTALDGVELGTDERGCLQITSAATNFERIQTNDVVEFIDHSSASPTRFRLVGRADRIINSGGVKVQPERVEQVIQATLAKINQSVPRLFVAGLPDNRLGQRIVVVYEQGAKGVGQGEISDKIWDGALKAVREELGPYAVPKEVIAISNFVETSTGKVDQKATVAQIQ